jgi:hypothetical protein
VKLIFSTNEENLMGRFTEEMRRLRESANCAQQERNQLIQDLNQFQSDLAHDVHHFLTDQQTTRLTQAAEDRANRQEFVNRLATETEQYCETFRQHLIEDVAQLRYTIQTKHADMAQHLRAEQTEFIENLTDSVNELREECYVDQQQRQQDFAEMAERERTARYDFVNNLQTTIAQMREDLSTDRAEASRIWLEMRAPSIHGGDEVSQEASPITSSTSDSTQSSTGWANQVTNKTPTDGMRDGGHFVSGFKTTVSNFMRDFREESDADSQTNPSKSDQ